MGLFKRRKKSEWKQGLIPTDVELEKDHMKLITATNTDIIFYKDIMSLQQVPKVLNIKTNVKTYSLMGKTERAKELQSQIMERMSANK